MHHPGADVTTTSPIAADITDMATAVAVAGAGAEDTVATGEAATGEAATVTNKAMDMATAAAEAIVVGEAEAVAEATAAEGTELSNLT